MHVSGAFFISFSVRFYFLLVLENGLLKIYFAEFDVYEIGKPSRFFATMNETNAHEGIRDFIEMIVEQDMAGIPVNGTEVAPPQAVSSVYLFIICANHLSSFSWLTRPRIPAPVARYRPMIGRKHHPA